MSLFETGFAVDSLAPAGEASTSASVHRKRKRAGKDAEGIKGTAELSNGQVNLEKLMKKLEVPERSRIRKRESKSKSKSMKQAKNHENENLAVNTTHKMETTPKIRDDAQVRASDTNAEKKALKRNHEKPANANYLSQEDASKDREIRQKKPELRLPRRTDLLEASKSNTSSLKAATLANMPAQKTEPPSSMTSLQRSMQKKLGGARFRWINEQLVIRLDFLRKFSKEKN